MPRILLAALATTVAFALPATASASVKLSGGFTHLTLDGGTAKALTGAGVKVTPVGPAKVRTTGAIAFPVTGGSIDPATAAGTINHSGGLRLRAGGTSVKLTDYRVKIGARSTLSAKVGQARVTILKLDTRKAKVSRSGFGTNVSGVRLTLTSAAAGALNSAFGVHLFKRGIVLGTVAAQFTPAQVQIEGGNTTLALDAGAAAALTSLGVTPGVIAPATAGASGLSFPITEGKVDAKTLAGTISHSGGISLTAGSTNVALTSFDIGISATPSLSALLGGTRADILSLDLTGITPQISGRTVTVPGVPARLTAGAASALNGAFGTSAFTAGLLLGKATVSAQGR